MPVMRAKHLQQQASDRDASQKSRTTDPHTLLTLAVPCRVQDTFGGQGQPGVAAEGDLGVLHLEEVLDEVRPSGVGRPPHRLLEDSDAPSCKVLDSVLEVKSDKELQYKCRY